MKSEYVLLGNNKSVPCLKSRFQFQIKTTATEGERETGNTLENQ